jgi:3-oxoadipate enol-lactonase
MTSGAPSTRFVEVPGARLAYDVTGQGPAIVLLHAWIVDRRMWADVIPDLARGHAVVRYDKRGYGETVVTGPMRYSNRRDVIAVLDAVRATRAVLVGVSGGATVALDTAIEFPQRVAALVLVAPGISGFQSDETPEEEAIGLEMERLEEAHEWDGLVELELKVWVDGPGGKPGRVPGVRERVRQMDLETYRRHGDEPLDDVEPLTPRATGRLGEVSVPTLVVVGTLDTSQTLAAARRIGEEVPGARVVTMPDVAHLPPMERPAEFAALVSTFLDEVGA